MDRKKNQSNSNYLNQPQAILTSLAPQLMSHRLLSGNSFNSTTFLNNGTKYQFSSTSSNITRAIRDILPPNLGGLKLKERLIKDSDSIDRLLSLELDHEPNPQLPFWTGFKASLPSSKELKLKRIKRRGEIGEKILGLNSIHSLGLVENLELETGLLGNNPQTRKSIGVGDEIIHQKNRKMRGFDRGRRRKTDIGLSKCSMRIKEEAKVEIKPEIPINELKDELEEILIDQNNLKIRKEIISKDLMNIEMKIKKLNEIKEELERSMLNLKEEELELIDEYEGIEESIRSKVGNSKSEKDLIKPISRRRKGPAFLPSEHDQLPKNVSFMTIPAHTKPISSIDFSNPYEYLISASFDSTLKLWDLSNGEFIKELKGHNGMIKCLQVEDSICITGGLDGQIRIWDLIKADNNDEDDENEDPCIMKLEGHTKPITSLYFDQSCLVTGSSDKTIRQWDINTGQAILTMDVLWAMQNHYSTKSTIDSKLKSPKARRLTSNISEFNFDSDQSSSNLNSQEIDLELNLPSIDDDNKNDDFIGGIQFWGYALASGSGDGCIRMWDMRTGQSHRTLIGHTNSISCLQFDEMNLISGSLDKSIKVWDLRTGMVLDTIKYLNPIQSLQFDSRKIISAAGTNSLHVYNRTTMQHSLINSNGHTDVLERLRYLDRYAITGARDGLVKIWSI
ncbi:hypothetical protein CROQUDRAFT_651184 [Cronartium quercuum f. sp. fusiforme G11]|uniref:Mitochondrial division protein 1 n=1 Tax=Cronartium quercuum f. sp. fusiforme G11 TaxID=708437 RepID=A0A9P6NQ87_9BASI|nr:hypothetical protein CROQUDRAFT_651184 [Cronartium quercuum f. sp. fusiforme G11]